MIAFLSQLLSILLLCLTSTAYTKDSAFLAQDFYASDHACRVDVRHIDGGGIGYEKGYTSIDAFFAPEPDFWAVMPFLDLRGHVFNNGQWAANIGLGLRKMIDCRVYGCNIFYDERKIPELNYNQIGLGIETLGKRWDFRFNAYLPVGKKITDPYGVQFERFEGHEMIISQEYQLAMRGFNAEFGLHFCKSRSFDFYAAAGTYFLAGSLGPKIWGGKGRLVAQFKEYWTLELCNSYDPLFHNRFQCQLTFSLPFGSHAPAKKMDLYESCDASNVLYSRMVQPVVKQEIVILECQKTCNAALDPETGDPLNFVFVNNNSHSAGTYESPYPTLAAAQANSKDGDFIYVYPGDGTTKGMNAGITLKPDQKFWGSGIDHSVITTQGTFVIPAQSSTAPQITNPDGSGITLAATNQVSGITIINTFDHGILGTGLKDIDIAHCTVKNSGIDQIHLEYSGASCFADLHDLTIINGVEDGISIDSSASSSTCNVRNCTMSGNQVFTIATTFDHQATLNIQDNSIIDNENGTNIVFDGPGNLLVTGNTITGTASVNEKPLLFTVGADPVSVTISNNTISDNMTGAIHCVLDNTDLAQLVIYNNQIRNNQSGAVGYPLGSSIVVTPAATTVNNCTLQLANNTFSDNAAASLACVDGDFNNFSVNAVDNIMTDNGGSGLTFTNACDTFTLVAKNNTIANSGNNGISTSGVLITSGNITISDNTITGTTGSQSAINLAHNGIDLNLVLTNNNLSDSEGSGFVMYSAGIENVAVQIENNIVNNNQNIDSNATGGIDVEQFINLSGTIAHNTMLDNVGYGLYVGSTNPSPYACITMKGNNSNTDYILVNDAGTFNLAPCNADAINTGTITTSGVITPVQSCPGAAAC